MNASQVLLRWQYQKYDQDYDKYFLLMSKKFRNLYPYSIYVLNKERKQNQRQQNYTLQQQQQHQAFSFQQSDQMRAFQQQNSIKTTTTITVKSQNQHTNNNNNNSTNILSQQYSRTEVKQQYNNGQMKNNNGQINNNERVNLSGSVFKKAIQDKKYSATEKKNDHNNHHNNSQLDSSVNADKKYTFSNINRVEETFLRKPKQTNIHNNLQKRSQSPLTTQYNSRAKTPTPQTGVTTTRKKSTKPKKTTTTAATQMKSNTDQKQQTQTLYNKLSRNKSTLNNNQNNMNKTQQIGKSKNNAMNSSKGWNIVEHEQICQYIDDAWVNYRDKKYKLNTADKSKQDQAEFTIDIQKLKNLKEEQNKRRDQLQQLSQRSKSPRLEQQMNKNTQNNKSQLLSTQQNPLIDNSLNYTSTKSKNIRDNYQSDYSSNSRSRSNNKNAKQFKIKPSTINHFTGQPIDNNKRDYTPTRSNTLFKKTFAMQQKEREKDQKFLDQQNLAFESIRFHQMAKNASPQQIQTLIKQQRNDKKQYENKVNNILDNNDNTKVSKDLLLRTQTLLSRSQSPNNVNNNQKSFKFQHQYDSPDHLSKTMDLNGRYNYNYEQDQTQSPANLQLKTLNIRSTNRGIEPEFSFQKGSSEERSASRTASNDKRNAMYLSSFQSYMRNSSPQQREHQDYTPAKLTNQSSNVIRRTRAQRLKNPDIDKFTNLGGTSAQKRASELMSNISPRVQELKRVSRMNSRMNSHRGSGRTSRAQSVKSSSRKMDNHYQNYQPGQQIQLNDDEDIAIANAQAYMIRNMSGQYDHDHLESPQYTSDSFTGTHRTTGSGYNMDTLLTRNKSIKSRDQYRIQEQQKAKEELRRIKERHSPSPNRRSASPHQQLSKSPYLDRNVKSFNQNVSSTILENDIYMSKFNQELAQQLYKKHLGQQNTNNNNANSNKAVPKLKSDQLFGNQ